MVTTAQLQIVQSPITSLLSTVSNSVTVKLDDTNYLVWNYQMVLLLESHGILGFVDGTCCCPSRFDASADKEGVETEAFQIWKMHDRALMQLLIATLSPTALSCIIGCINSHEMWQNLKDRFSTITKACIFQLKTELQNIKKGSESVSQYLQRIKDARDHLSAAGVVFDDDDIVILALKGLPAEYNTFRTVIRGREDVITLKDFRAQLIAEEAIVEAPATTDPFMSAMMAKDKGKLLMLDEGSSNHDRSFQSDSSQFSSGVQDSSSSRYGTNRGYPHSAGQYNPGGSNGHSNSFHPGGYRSFNYRGRARGRNQYGNHPHGNHPRFSNNGSPNGGAGILGPARGQPHISTCPDHGYDVPVCQICNKRGHIAADCFQRHSSTTVTSSPVQCQICGKFGHSALQCYHRANYSYQGRSPSSNLTAMHANYQPSAPQEQFWVADTGATSHMTSDLASLNTVAPFTGIDTITTASGSGKDHREGTSSGTV